MVLWSLLVLAASAASAAADWSNTGVWIGALSRYLELEMPDIRRCDVGTRDVGEKRLFLTGGVTEGGTAKITNSGGGGIDNRTFAHSLIVCLDGGGGGDDSELIADFRAGVEQPWLVAYDGRQTDLNSFSPRINQQLYFYDSADLSLRETYVVNGIRTTAFLGRVSDNGTFVPGYRGSQPFLERRASDLGGLELVATVETQAPYVIVEKEGEEAIVSASGDVFHAVGWDDLSGEFADVFRVLSREMNFSVRLLRREDRQWAAIKDGKWTGMVSTLLKGEADLALVSLTMTELRATAVDFLLPVGLETAAIFIRKATLEEYDWIVFVELLATPLWATLLLGAAASAAVLKFLGLAYHGRDGAGSIAAHYWTVFYSYFGCRSPWTIAAAGNGEQGLRIFLFFTFLAGNVVFMSYRAALTSELSVRDIRMPFDSVKTMYHANYRFGMRIYSI